MFILSYIYHFIFSTSLVEEYKSDNETSLSLLFLLASLRSFLMLSTTLLAAIIAAGNLAALTSSSSLIMQIAMN